MSFLQHMYDTLGLTDAPVISEAKIDAVKEPEPVREMVAVQIMDCDMKDSFYRVDKKNLAEFINKFLTNEYSYHIGGVFGSPRKLVNEGKPDWRETFKEYAKPGKKVKTKYYIDMTDPMETIKEVSGQMRISYPDLIVGF